MVERAGGRCEICGAAVIHRQGGEVHHRLPRGSGGSSDPAKGQASNALLLCLDHHRYVETNPPDVYDNGWKIRHGHAPSEVPALLLTLYGRDRWLLTDDGMYVPANAA